MKNSLIDSTQKLNFVSHKRSFVIDCFSQIRLLHVNKINLDHFQVMFAKSNTLLISKQIILS